jgi:lipopolysaccharide export system permease protein
VKLISGPFERRINRDLNAILKLNNDYNEILNSLKQKMAI